MIFSLTSPISPVVKMTPTLPIIFSARAIQVSSPLRSQYSRMHLRIMVFLPMRTVDWGRSAWKMEESKEGDKGERRGDERARMHGHREW